ncbi:MAG TPA: hypothetical protein VFB50_11685 [Chloroflexota bacterium]|nr:hypothetical protein [Chloroflexota bacterium]
MTHGWAPQSGSLSARIIRACPMHADCSLECSERTVEDLGEVASFDNRRITQKIKEGYLKWRASAPTPAKPS